LPPCRTQRAAKAEARQSGVGSSPPSCPCPRQTAIPRRTGPPFHDSQCHLIRPPARHPRSYMGQSHAHDSVDVPAYIGLACQYSSARGPPPVVLPKAREYLAQKSAGRLCHAAVPRQRRSNRGHQGQSGATMHRRLTRQSTGCPRHGPAHR